MHVRRRCYRKGLSATAQGAGNGSVPSAEDAKTRSRPTDKAQGCKEDRPDERGIVAHARVVRIGEAANPGLVVSMPGDGNCRFYALGFWAKQDQRQVRETVAQGALAMWEALFPWDARDAATLHARRPRMESGEMAGIWP